MFLSVSRLKGSGFLNRISAQDGLISINLSQDNQQQETQISRLDSISVLTDITKQEGSRFVYNGMILNPSLTFAFYGITEKDIIYVLPPEPKEVQKIPEKAKLPDMTKQLRDHFNKHWAHRTADPEEAFQRFKDTADPKTARENARIMDLQRSKMEANPAQYRKMCLKFQNSNMAKPLDVPAKIPISSQLQKEPSLGINNRNVLPNQRPEI